MVPGFTPKWCEPAGICRVAGVLPTKLPSASISAPSGSEVMCTDEGLAGEAAAIWTGAGCLRNRSRAHDSGLQHVFLVGEHVYHEPAMHGDIFALYEEENGSGHPECHGRAGR